jgi:hypothetical protein
MEVAEPLQGPKPINFFIFYFLFFLPLGGQTTLYGVVRPPEIGQGGG